jgi:hypothetical protein
MRSRAVRHFVAVTAVIAVAAYVLIYARSYADAPIRSDGYSYYVYLPATFIYHDATLDALARDWYGGAYPDFTAIRRVPATGRWLDACPIGVATLMLPFFLVADALSWWSNLPRDGFSLYYQHAAGLAGLTYLLLGLALVRGLLRRHFEDGVVLATLVCLTWGTNLFHYGTYDATFSHAFSFFLVAAWLVVVDRWWGRATIRDTVLLAFVAAAIVLTRAVNGIVFLLLPLFGVTGPGDLRARIHDLWERRGYLVLAAVVAFACVVPQLALYKVTTGRFVVNSYELLNNRFAFGSPRIGAVWFSTQKGLFFWSPALLLAVGGAIFAKGWTRGLVIAAAIIFGLQTYIVASWSDWQLGGSYGHRAFTDGLAFAAPLMASAFAWVAERARRLVPVAIFASAAVLLSVVQMLQYWLGVLPIIDTSWAQYRMLFLRFR